MVKMVWACDWGVGWVSPVKIVKILKILRACGGGVGWVPPVIIVQMVKILKMISACGWGEVVYYRENSENCEIGMGL